MLRNGLEHLKAGSTRISSREEHDRHSRRFAPVCLILISTVSYLLAAFLLRYGLSAVFARLFELWGIGPDNAYLAPGWARFLYDWNGHIVSALTALALLLFSAFLRRIWKINDYRIQSVRSWVCRSGLIGLGCSALAVCLSLIPDSMRLEWPLTAPGWDYSVAFAAIIILLRILSEEVFLKRVLFDGLIEYWGTAAVVVTGSLAFLLLRANEVACVVGWFNLFLTGALTCLLYSSFGLAAVICFRTGWEIGCLLVWGSNSGGNRSLYRMYAVSENLMTGGDYGLINGLWATIVLSGCLIWLAWRHANPSRNHKCSI